MSYPPEPYISALLSLSPAGALGRRDDSWRSTFPFSSPFGGWAFSGRAALAAGLAGLGLEAGAQILVPAYFQGTEIDTLLRRGYKLKFFRVRPDFSANLDDIERLVTDRTAALYIIHYFGLPQPLDELAALAHRRGIKLIEDCALSLYSRDSETWLGSRGDLSFFSVYKTVPLPHGGYVVLKEPGRIEVLPPPPLQSTFNQTIDLMMEHLLSTGHRSPLGRTRRAFRLVRRVLGWTRGEVVESGSIAWDKRILDFGASRLVRELMNLHRPEDVVARRRENFRILHGLLREHSVLKFEHLPTGTCPLFYPIVVHDKEAAQRALRDRGVGSINLWSQSHSVCPKELTAEVLPWRQHILELPVHQLLDGNDVERVGRITRGYLENHCGVIAADRPVMGLPTPVPG
jgi:perosamine synthetase